MESYGGQTLFGTADFFGRVDYDESGRLLSRHRFEHRFGWNSYRPIKASYNMEHILSLVNVASRGDSVHYELRNEDYSHCGKK